MFKSHSATKTLTGFLANIRFFFPTATGRPTAAAGQPPGGAAAPLACLTFDLAGISHPVFSSDRCQRRSMLLVLACAPKLTRGHTPGRGIGATADTVGTNAGTTGARLAMQHRSGSVVSMVNPGWGGGLQGGRRHLLLLCPAAPAQRFGHGGPGAPPLPPRQSTAHPSAGAAARALGPSSRQ